MNVFKKVRDAELFGSLDRAKQACVDGEEIGSGHTIYTGNDSSVGIVNLDYLIWAFTIY